MLTHIKCRNAIYPSSSVTRFHVPDDKVQWNVVWECYQPPSFTSPVLNNKPWADPDIPSELPWNSVDQERNVDRRSHNGPYEIVDGLPRNPIGRTGIRERGLLGRWGPNHAADPIVTRWKRDSSGHKVQHSESNLFILQFVAIQRRDSKEWAIPGGMIDPGELVTKTLQREFCEEAMNSLEMTTEEQQNMETSLQSFFSSGQEIFKGYVDDPRNTDNAWMETVAINFHDETGSGVAGNLNLNAGDDAMKVRWTDIAETLQLYASHSTILKRVAKLRNAHW